MAWKIEFKPEAEHDLSLIFDHLLATYQDLGDDIACAFERAATRVSKIRESAESLVKKPYRGTKRDEIGHGLRNVTINKAVIWFLLDEENKVVRVLAFFFDGQNHTRHMLTRLLDPGQ